jgi:hypothetical protein
MAINQIIGQHCLVKGGILRHNYNFCYFITKGNVWTWVHIHHKIMQIHFGNLKNPNVLGV